MTEPAYLAAVRESYDTVAADYVKHVITPAEMDPLARALLAAFAELVRTSGSGPIADLGCGPGRVTAHLTALGVSAFGVDVSPKMVELAREAYPELRYSQGSMTSLDLPDNGLGGILTWWSTQHTPPELLPVVFAEFTRTLVPGGHLLMGLTVGDEDVLQPIRGHGGHPVSYETYRLPLDRLATMIDDAGLAVTARILQEPGEREKRQSGYLMARKRA
jgi:SAM-dependent methyltransferase